MIDTELFIIERLEKEVFSIPANDKEITQHLIELGYLSVAYTNVLTEIQVNDAKEQFKEDLFASDLITKQELSALVILENDQLIKHFLRRLTDIDEGIMLKELPEIGKISLQSRLIHYRLELLGLFEHPVSQPFNHTAMLQIKWLVEITKSKKEIDAINLLSDIENFTRYLLSIYEDQDFILTFHSQHVSEKTRNKLDRRRLFGNQLKDDFGEKTDFLKHLRKHVLKANENKIDYGFLAKDCLNKIKRLIIRIIQIHQWQDGFYNGLLDSDLGEISIQSILQSIEVYNEADNKQIKPHRFLTYLGKGYFLFNALFFLKEYMLEDNTGDENKIWNSLNDKLKASKESEQNLFLKNLEEIKQKAFENIDPHERKGLLVRVYYGIHKLMKKAHRFLNKIYKWILTKAERITKFLKKLFGGFFDKLRTGLKYFIDGIKFLVGRKLIFTGNKNNFLITKCSLDGDSSTLAIKSNQSLVSEHIKEIKYQWGTLQFSLALIGSVFKIVIQSINIITWPVLLFTIVNSFKTIQEQFQNISIN